MSNDFKSHFENEVGTFVSPITMHRRLRPKKGTAKIIAKFPLERHEVISVSFFNLFACIGKLEKNYFRVETFFHFLYLIIYIYVYIFSPLFQNSVSSGKFLKFREFDLFAFHLIKFGTRKNKFQKLCQFLILFLLQIFYRHEYPTPCWFTWWKYPVTVNYYDDLFSYLAADPGNARYFGFILGKA